MKTIKSFFYLSYLAGLILSGSAQAASQVGLQILNNTPFAITATGSGPQVYTEDFGTIYPRTGQDHGWSTSWNVANFWGPYVIEIKIGGGQNASIDPSYDSATTSCANGYFQVDVVGTQNNQPLLRITNTAKPYMASDC